MIKKIATIICFVLFFASFINCPNPNNINDNSLTIFPEKVIEAKNLSDKKILSARLKTLEEEEKVITAEN